MRKLGYFVSSFVAIGLFAACAPSSQFPHPKDLNADAAAAAAAQTQASPTPSSSPADHKDKSAVDASPSPTATPVTSPEPPGGLSQGDAPGPAAPPPPPPPPPASTSGGVPQDLSGLKMNCTIESEQTVWIHVSVSQNNLVFTAKVADCRSHLKLPIESQGVKWAWNSKEGFSAQGEDAQALLPAATHLNPFLHSLLAGLGGIGAAGLSLETVTGLVASPTVIGGVIAAQGAVTTGIVSEFVFEQLVRRQIEIDMKKIAAVLISGKANPSEAETTIHLHGYLNQLASIAHDQINGLLVDLKRMSQN